MTPAELRALAEAATPGPWMATHLDRFEESRVLGPGGNTMAFCDGRVYIGQEARADFIAAANPETIKLLCDLWEAAVELEGVEIPVRLAVKFGSVLAALESHA